MFYDSIKFTTHVNFQSDFKIIYFFFKCIFIFNFSHSSRTGNFLHASDTFYLENIKSEHLLGMLKGTIMSRSTYNGIFEDVFLIGSHDADIDIYRYLCATNMIFDT